MGGRKKQVLANLTFSSTLPLTILLNITKWVEKNPYTWTSVIIWTLEKTIGSVHNSCIFVASALNSGELDYFNSVKNKHSPKQLTWCTLGVQFWNQLKAYIKHIIDQQTKEEICEVHHYLQKNIVQFDCTQSKIDSRHATWLSSILRIQA